MYKKCIQDREEVLKLSNREIKERLTAARIDHSSAIERDDLILMMMRLVERELFNKTRANQPPSFSRNDPQAQNVQINNGTFFFHILNENSKLYRNSTLNGKKQSLYQQ